MVATLHIRTRVHLALLAQTAALRISHAAGIAAAFVASTGQLLAHRVITAWIAQARTRCHLLALDHGIAHMTRRTRALRITVDHPTLGVHATRTDLQTRILARSTLATLVRVTVAVLLAFERRAL